MLLENEFPFGAIGLLTLANACLSNVSRRSSCKFGIVREAKQQTGGAFLTQRLREIANLFGPKNCICQMLVGPRGIKRRWLKAKKRRCVYRVLKGLMFGKNKRTANNRHQCFASSGQKKFKLHMFSQLLHSTLKKRLKQ